MSQVPNKYDVKVAAPKPSRIPMPKHVVMTHDFGTINPIECKICFPGDKWNIDVSHFTRLMPMPSPTFGKVDVITRAFFVPCRVLFKDWKEFISNNLVPQGAPSSVSLGNGIAPTTNVDMFTKAFLGSGLGLATRSESDSYDFLHYSIMFNELGEIESLDQFRYVLTYRGRVVLSMLRGLGYNIPFVSFDGIDGVSQSVLDSLDSEGKTWVNTATQKLSLLPLLSFLRFYIDWIIPSRFVNNHLQVLAGLRAVYRDDSAYQYLESYAGIDKRQYTSSLLVKLLAFPTSYLEDDFFTSAFVSPYGYESNMANSTSLPNYADNPTFNFDSVAVDSQGRAGANVVTSDIVQATDDRFAINAFTLKSLGALQDMVNRGKVAGTKIQDYLKVTYGIEPSSEALDLSVYLGSHRSTIQIGDVMSNADTKTSDGGAYLGEYAGRALGGKQNMKFSYECKEHGFLIVTTEIQARTSYWQGLRPECTAIDRLDFFQPELDNLGVEAIPQSLLNNHQYLDSDSIESTSRFVDINSVFGFTPRYSKYKVNFDSLLGDFRVPTLNTGLDSWYLARYIQSQQYINEQFTEMVQNNTSVEYDKIFQVADNSADHFYSIYNLDIVAYRHMKSLTESLEVEEGSRDVSASFNGSINS